MNKTDIDDIQRQALQWLSRLRDSECSELDRQAFQDWLNGTPGHAQAYRQVQQFWDGIGGLPELAGKRLTEARGFVRTNQMARRRKNITLIVAAIAAGLVIQHPEPLQKLAAVKYQTAKGERFVVRLDDGSRIELNTATTLRVDRFGSRTIWLDRGEAWFNVKHDAERPFEVRLDAGTIRDVGTQFNVIAYPEQTSVAVSEGEVALSAPGQQELPLTSGMQSGFAADGSLQTPGRAEPATGAWRNGTLIFKNQPLPEVLRQLARYHPVEFELPDAKLQNLTVSGRFSTTNLDENLTTLSNGLGVQVARFGASKILITAAR